MDVEEPKATILLLEDDPTTRRFLHANLAADGYAVLECSTVAEAEWLIETQFPDLALLDLTLPDGDALDLIRRVRESDRAVAGTDPALSLIVISGRTDELDRLRGFSRGVDDYVCKPFSYPELLARIEALLWRTEMRPARGRQRIGPLEIDSVSRRAWVNGEVVKLSTKEFSLLRTLAADPDRVFTREELMRGVWGYRAIGSTRTVDSHASRLRRKLSIGGASFVVNCWGVGYRLTDGPLEV
jgi:DNA-binding response OmpR family regulator